MYQISTKWVERDVLYGVSTIHYTKIHIKIVFNEPAKHVLEVRIGRPHLTLPGPGSVVRADVIAHFCLRKSSLTNLIIGVKRATLKKYR